MINYIHYIVSVRTRKITKFVSYLWCVRTFTITYFYVVTSWVTYDALCMVTCIHCYSWAKIAPRYALCMRGGAAAAQGRCSA